MTRTVLDTNAIVSALLFNDSAPGRALIKALDTGTILVSAALAQELQDVLNRPRFDRYVTREERDEFLMAFMREAELVEITETVEVCRDPKDDQILELGRQWERGLHRDRRRRPSHIEPVPWHCHRHAGRLPVSLRTGREDMTTTVATAEAIRTALAASLGHKPYCRLRSTTLNWSPERSAWQTRGCRERFTRWRRSPAWGRFRRLPAPFE